MIKFLHAADLHLDAPFSALSPEQAAERRQEQRALLQELADAASAHEAAMDEDEAAFTEAAEEQLAQTQAQRRFFYLRR